MDNNSPEIAITGVYVSTSLILHRRPFHDLISELGQNKINEKSSNSYNKVTTKLFRA